MAILKDDHLNDAQHWLLISLLLDDYSRTRRPNWVCAKRSGFDAYNTGYQTTLSIELDWIIPNAAVLYHLTLLAFDNYGYLRLLILEYMLMQIISLIMYLGLTFSIHMKT